MDEIEMRPGRELDALVAEKVMGLRVIEPLREYYKHPTMVTDEIPQYSTDIAAAMSVAEHVRATTHLDCFSLYSPTDTSQNWFAWFDKKWHGRGAAMDCVDFYFEFVSGDTAPHAICLAALRAVAKL